ncbi:DsbA family oxidoreductase [Persicobacter diffluens]|uniref:2-hydroxychromene-2-carboxylate isomerase n=1 Tax=Persicobacter diffluens TaxID=981 RepID=A0AAN4VVI5_9BACT|nr:2-hydroxychromene-2-carboxylate isomerase [Persicobacter diffluens]
MKKLKIEIVSDVVCPWCYIGVSRLEKALKSSGNVKAEISWRPFQLHPEIQAGNQEHYETFLGNKYQQDPKPMIAQMEAVAQQEGVNMNFSKVKNVPNTLQAHRLMHFARMEGKDDALSRILFQAYFEMGADVENLKTLAQYGEQAGMSKLKLEEFLQTDHGMQEVNREEAAFRAEGIAAVPTFIINDQFMIQGAQTPENWSNAFQQIENHSKDDGACCGSDGCC